MTDTKLLIQDIIKRHDEGKMTDGLCADMLKRLIEIYFREQAQ